MQFPPSVNNFAYHVAFETPPDGRNNTKNHSGYTQVQYNSLAWLVAQSKVPEDRITTHKAVDRSGSRIDPRSFNFQKFLSLLKTYRGLDKSTDYGNVGMCVARGYENYDRLQYLCCYLWFEESLPNL